MNKIKIKKKNKGSRISERQPPFPGLCKQESKNKDGWGELSGVIDAPTSRCMPSLTIWNS
jgi:hypothetical protein